MYLPQSSFSDQLQKVQRSSNNRLLLIYISGTNNSVFSIYTVYMYVNKTSPYSTVIAQEFDYHTTVFQQ